MAPSSADEVPYLSQISACSNPAGTEIELINHSAVVWDLRSTPGGANVTYSTPDWAQSIFRASLPPGHHAVMEPGSRVAIAAPPANTSWYADPELTTVWQAQSALIDAARERAADAIKDELPKIFSPKSGRGQAWIACGLAVYGDASKVVDQGNNKLDAQGVADLVKDAQGLGQSIADCREKLAAADELDVREARISEPTLATAETTVRAPAWTEEAEKALEDAAIVRAIEHVRP